MKLVKCKSNDRPINSKNHIELAPFSFEDDICVMDSVFFRKIRNTSFMREILKDFRVVSEDNVTYGTSEYTDKFLKVYTAHYAWYSAEKWEKVVPRIVTYHLDDEELELAIQKKCGSYTAGMIEVTAERKKLCTVESFKRDGVFAKLGMTSPKHEYSIRPCYSGIDVLEYLLPSKKVQRFLPICRTIALSNWEKEISPQNEYRVFVADNKVRSISQQFCYYDHLPYSLETVYTDVIEKMQEFWNNALPNIEYTDVVIDIYLDRNMEPQVLELNPYGAWSGAGSSLFHWIDDPPETEEIEFRYVCDS